jgi:hypothetical protein
VNTGHPVSSRNSLLIFIKVTYIGLEPPVVQ